MDILSNEFIFEELDEFMLRPPERRQFIIDGGILPKCGGMILFGLAGVGKTMMARQLALDLICGLPFLDRFAIEEPVPVALIQCEIEESLFYQRMKPLIEYYKSYEQWSHRQPLWICSDLAPIAINSPSGFQALVKSIRNLNPIPQVVILDPLGSLMAGDELSPVDAKSFIRSLGIISRILGTSFIILHHQRKSSPDRPYLGSQELFGSTAFSRWADSIINIRDKNMNGRYELRFTKVRHAPAPQPLSIELDPQFLRWKVRGPARGETINWAKDRIIDLISNAPGDFSIPMILELMVLEGFSRKDIQRALDSLMADRVIVKKSDSLFLSDISEDRTHRSKELSPAELLLSDEEIDFFDV